MLLTFVILSSRHCVVDVFYPSHCEFIFVDLRFSVSVNLFCGLVFFCHGKFFFFFLTLVFLLLGVCVVDVCFPVIKSLSL